MGSWGLASLKRGQSLSLRQVGILSLHRICACEQLASNSTSDAIFKLVLENRAPRAGGDSRAAQGGRRPAHAGCVGRQARLRLSARRLRQVAPASASHMPQTQPLTRFSNLCSKTEHLAPAATPARPTASSDLLTPAARAARPIYSCWPAV